MARSPRDLRASSQVAGPYIARLRAHATPIDPKKGYGLLSPDILGGDGRVLDAARRLFEIKKADIDAELTGFDTGLPNSGRSFSPESSRSSVTCSTIEICATAPSWWSSR